MPRKGKGSKVPQENGAPNRVPMIDAPGQPYGERKALVDAQRAAPVNPATPPPSQAPPQSATAGALQAIQGGGMAPPVERPDPSGPITAGLSRGPGVGPEAIMPTRQMGKISSQLQQMAAVFDDPIYMELANRAQQRGL